MSIGQRPRPIEREKISADFDKAMAFYRNTVGLFSQWSEIRKTPTAFHFGIRLFAAVGGDPTSSTTTALSLASDEVMVVTLPSVPDCQTWNLQVDNY